MKLSAKEQHAVKAMINLAISDNYKPKTLIELSRHQGISLSYLEQLFSLLRKNNLVKGVRGPGGGYSLSTKPNNITIAQILSAVNNINSDINSNKPDEIIWSKFSNNLNKYLSTITLEKLIEKDTITENGANRCLTAV